MAPRHITDDDLELYPLGRLAEPDVTPVEERLLVCLECRARSAGWDGYVGAMRGPLRVISAEGGD